MSKLLDPWEDASLLAERVAGPDRKLFIIIGAEQWCAKCRDLRVQFDAVATEADEYKEVWLWLDLEDHAEFVGDYIPENLPMLISYRGAQFLNCVHIADPTLSLIDMRPLPVHSTAPDPGIRSRLLMNDWAN